MPVIGALLIALAIGVAAYSVFAPRTSMARSRLDEIANAGATRAGDDALGVGGRVIRPLAGGIGGTLSSVLPEHVGRWLEEEIAAAGMTMRPGHFLLLMGASFAGFVFPMLAMANDLPPALAGFRTLLLVLAVGIGAAGPIIWLRGRATRRQREIERALPDTLDLIVVSVEAGLGFEAALARIVDHTRGPLSDELRRVLADVNLGLSRREAMQTMAKRARTTGVSSLVSAILQSERTGMGVGQVLRSQASHVRTLRRQRAEEAAMKAPLKMLFPLVFFIFPSLFVVVLGPAVLSLLQQLGGG